MALDDLLKDIEDAMDKLGTMTDEQREAEWDRLYEQLIELPTAEYESFLDIFATKAGIEMDRQAEEAERELLKTVHPFWDSINKRARAGHDLLVGDLKAPEMYEDEDEKQKADTLEIVFKTVGEYPDGTKWENTMSPNKAEELMG